MPYQAVHHGSIPGGLYPSRVITVSGIVLQNAQGFNIDLRTENDIAFHFNPRFHANSVVRNSHIQGSWGPEELDLPSGMPFRCGRSFTVEITCEADCYRVSVNGQPLPEYAHRVKDLRAICHLNVGGDIELFKVSA